MAFRFAHKNLSSGLWSSVQTKNDANVYSFSNQTFKYNMKKENKSTHETKEPATIVIAGAGIVGLVLALAIKKHLGITSEIYEKARAFHDDVGAALGMYPNGMRVIRDIDPELMQAIRDNGYPYLFRRWEKHDGTEIASASEGALSPGDEELCSIGIRRWKLQKVLYDAVLQAGMKVHFAKASCGLIEHENDLIEVQFTDGTSRFTRLLMGADGGKSAVRRAVADPKAQLQYDGVTCLMGISDCPRPRRGISFPSSASSRYHAVFFPTGPNEQCFQIHYPVREEHSDKSTWGTLSKADGRVKFEEIAELMKADGWHDQYTEPLYRVEHAVEVGFALLKPRLKKWVYGRNRRIILVGDAAHPPVPYVGQGAQMGVEDCGTLCLILKHFCLDKNGKLNVEAVGEATRLYERIRIPRSSRVLDASKRLGTCQELRSSGNPTAAKAKELFIKSEVMMKDTLPLMFPGAGYNYSTDVMEAIEAEEDQRRHSKKSKSDSTPASLLELLELHLPPAVKRAPVRKLSSFEDLVERYRAPNTVYSS